MKYQIAPFRGAAGKFCVMTKAGQWVLGNLLYEEAKAIINQTPGPWTTNSFSNEAVVLECPGHGIEHCIVGTFATRKLLAEALKPRALRRTTMTTNHDNSIKVMIDEKDESRIGLLGVSAELQFVRLAADYNRLKKDKLTLARILRFGRRRRIT